MPSKVDVKCGRCPKLIARQTRSGFCNDCFKAKKAEDAANRVAAQPKNQIAADRERTRLQAEVAAAKLKYSEAVKIMAGQENDLKVLGVLQSSADSYVIRPSHPSGTSEATAVLVASDWHSEEVVGNEVNGLNVFNPEICKARAEKFFSKGLRLIRLLAQDIKIPRIVLPLLGDFITNQIHGADNAETNAMQPMHALIVVQNHLISGIDFLLEHTKADILIPCHSGNHARTTLKTRFASENGHSLEFLMYNTLRSLYRNNPRVTFVIPDGMHSYVQVYDTMIRFHHGHAIKYGGGVGGIFIPAFKAIAQWNRGIQRPADLDVFGHFHQMVDGGNFLCNGSLIGYNAFAMSIKASFEPPKQTLFLMDKRRGRTCTWPILVK